jgi:hypothetical protein
VDVDRYSLLDEHHLPLEDVEHQDAKRQIVADVVIIVEMDVVDHLIEEV